MEIREILETDMRVPAQMCLQNMGGILIENGAEQHYKSVVLTPGPEAVLMLISF